MEIQILLYIAIGVSAAVVLSCLLCCFCCRKRKQKYDEESLLESLDYHTWFDQSSFMSKVGDMRNLAESADTEEAKKRIYQVTAEAVVGFNRIRNPRNDVDADFHYLTVPEVKQYLPVVLDKAFTVQHKMVFMIDTGKGNHSEDGRGVLKHVVPKILSEYGYKSFTGPDGFFTIYRPDKNRRNK